MVNFPRFYEAVVEPLTSRNMAAFAKNALPLFGECQDSSRLPVAPDRSFSLESSLASGDCEYPEPFACRRLDRRI